MEEASSPVSKFQNLSNFRDVGAFINNITGKKQDSPPHHHQIPTSLAI